MKSTIRKIGNSQGILIPKPLISQLNLDSEVELKIEKDAIVIRKASKRVRHGWATAAKKIAELGDDRPVWPAFANLGDEKLRW